MLQAIDITNVEPHQLKYSICTFVTRQSQYAEMLESFVRHGFAHDDCEYLYIDNTAKNNCDAYAGINRFLTTAKGKYIILCHQDVSLISDGRKQLDSIVEKLDHLDPNWGLFGNAGGVHPGRLAIRITDPLGDNQFRGPLPARVESLDENFIVFRRDANLAASRDLHGFHLYGTDVCVIADILGYSAYVVDFHLRHHSAGERDRHYYAVREDLIAKYGRALRSRIVAAPTTIVFLFRNGLLRSILNREISTKIVRRVGMFFARLRA